VENSYPQL